MGNNAKKREEAKRHNEIRRKRLELEKDKRDNPEKYKRRRQRVKSMAAPSLAMFLAMSGSI